MDASLNAVMDMSIHLTKYFNNVITILKTSQVSILRLYIRDGIYYINQILANIHSKQTFIHWQLIILLHQY